MKRIAKILLVLVGIFAVSMTASCGKEIKVSSSWKMDSENHWHVGIDSTELYDKGAHSMVLIKTENPSCTVDGYKQYKCSVCGYIYEETLSATKHTVVLVDAVEPECTCEGHIAYYECSKCHEIFSDKYAKKSITEAQTVVAPTGHTLTYMYERTANYFHGGNVECYHCEDCDKYFTDNTGSTELSGDVITKQLRASVEVARNEMGTGDVFIVRGIVAGVIQTNSGLNLRGTIVLKDENSNVCMALACAPTTVIGAACGSYSDIKMPYEIGTILEVQVSKTKASISYPSGNAGIYFLQNSDKDTKLDDYVVGKTVCKFDLDDKNIPTISTQSDFWKFLGIKNGDNNPDSVGYEYSIDDMGANAFKLVKMENLQVVKTASDTTENPLRTWRPMFDASVNTWALSALSYSSNSTNKIGAKQSYYPHFYDLNTYVNCGVTFSELVFGKTAADSAVSKTWANHLTTTNTVYTMYVGGSDYYIQFAVLSTDWVVAK